MNTLYKLRNWVDEYKLNYFMLSMNENAVYYLEQYPHKIRWNTLNHQKEKLIVKTMR